MRKLLAISLILIASVLSAQVVNVTDNITEDTKWTADNVYTLDGLIFVDSLATLTIEAGTVVKGIEASNITTGDAASALIVRRGAKIYALGTKDAPVIFTSELDDLSSTSDLSVSDRGLWGGVIVLGNATTNQPTTENQIEGIPNETATLARYGGNNDEDNSGVLQYVSIRHGGFSISGVQGDEINGLTLGAVGSKTVIEHVEVLANFDDGYEWFGGTVNMKYIVAAFCGDDCFDYDQGWRGKAQFVFSIQGTDEAGRGGEHDGGDDDETGTPYALPVFANATYIGSGSSSANVGGDGNDRALYFRDNAGGKYYNSIFTDFVGYGVKVEDLESGEDSKSRMESGDLVLANNFWYNFGAGNTLAAIADDVEFVETHLTDNGNKVEDPMLRGISRTADAGLDPRPMYASPATHGAVEMEDAWYKKTSYNGAFNPMSELWTNGWTALDAMGFTGDIDGGAQGVVNVTENITEDVVWSASNVYTLDGLIFVDSLATLTIEAGTVVKGIEASNITTGDAASALIVRRGGKIMAEGTAAHPIIFTSELDDVNDATDLLSSDRGLWGGVILLGNATTNQPTTENQIEGIPNETATLARYGGNNDEDNSGILRYVSIRHGGFSISGVQGDEINGLTMGAVGSGTTIEYVEVFANFDDGYEWFGGTVNMKNIIAAFCGDDCFDYDQGWRGQAQFVFSIQGSDEAGRAGEHDGGDDDETGTPYAIPVFANATYIGAGSSSSNVGGDGNDRALYFRDNAGGKYYSSIFTDFVGYGVKVEDLESGEDSKSRMEAGDLVLTNNYWFNFGAGNSASEIADGVDFVQTHLTNNGNKFEDPMLKGISRVPNKGLDPRPLLNSPAVTGATQPEGDFFTTTGYCGAFSPNAALWTDGWTALDQMGYMANGGNTGTAGTVNVTSNITSDTKWTADNVYTLDGLIFVDSLATLTIEAGTVVKGIEASNITTGDAASALIVRRGGKIMAEGTATNPIIFTSELDDVNNTTDLLSSDRGLWGGVILLGNATTNQPTTENQIEGIPNETATLARYGGSDDSDNSGVLKYVSIRHGGFSISGVQGDEINGLTLGAVGSGTTIENVEVFANFDDGYEWFGGTVNMKNIVAAFCGDDCFDYDQGWRGQAQFVFSIQGSDEAGRAGEHDGGDDDETGMPYAMPVFSNATYIGSGATASNVGGDGNDRALYFRDNAGGKYYSSIFTDFVGYGVKVEDLESGEDSKSRMEAGDLMLSDNFWFNFGAGNSLSAIADGVDFVMAHLSDNGNMIADPALVSVSREANGMLNPRPRMDGPAASGASMPVGEFYDAVDYYGAFAPNAPMWTDGWTALYSMGYTEDLTVDVEGEEVAPTSYALSQNYPNPFNPSTTISFTLPQASDVKLAVYNVLGQEVAVLLNGAVNAGTHNVRFDASNLASGMYVYLIEAGDFRVAKKMTLLK